MVGIMLVVVLMGIAVVYAYARNYLNEPFLAAIEEESMETVTVSHVVGR
jgi:hypothetical protein